MTKLKASEFDALTNELSVRDLTEDEIAALEAKAAEKAEKLAKAQTEAEAKAQAKAALLTQLGITEEQAKLLLS
jgi:FMN-dependent NADH-azoreductase